jgi:hypothetical protein
VAAPEDKFQDAGEVSEPQHAGERHKDRHRQRHSGEYQKSSRHDAGDDCKLSAVPHVAHVINHP